MPKTLLLRSGCPMGAYVRWLVIAALLAASLYRYGEQRSVGMLVLAAVLFILFLLLPYWRFQLYEDRFVLQQKRLLWFLGKSYTYPIHSLKDVEISSPAWGMFKFLGKEKNSGTRMKLSIMLEGHRRWIIYSIYGQYGRFSEAAERISRMQRLNS